MFRENQLIAEFSSHFLKKPENEINTSLPEVLNVIVTILQNYQRDIRSKGNPGDWQLTRVIRPGLGLFGKHTNKDFIFSDGLSIPTSRMRLFIIDGLQDTKQSTNVIAAEGSLLHALSDKHIKNFEELKSTLALFSSKRNLNKALQDRCKNAGIDPDKKYSELLGNNRLADFINYVCVTLVEHPNIFKNNTPSEKIVTDKRSSLTLQAATNIQEQDKPVTNTQQHSPTIAIAQRPASPVKQPPQTTVITQRPASPVKQPSQTTVITQPPATPATAKQESIEKVTRRPQGVYLFTDNGNQQRQEQERHQEQKRHQQNHQPQQEYSVDHHVVQDSGRDLHGFSHMHGYHCGFDHHS
jgi:hypothetical protein